MAAHPTPKHSARLVAAIRRRLRGTSRIRVGRAAIAALTVLLTAITGLAVAAPATAAPPVYEINGHWVNPPDTVASGNPLVAEWRVNINDSANPPSNDPVDNVVATFTVGKGIFNEIPNMCLKSGPGVDPAKASNISPDGLTLTCNFGSVKMGTALVVQTPIVAQGITGDEVSLNGTSPSGEPVDLPHIPIKNTFAEDIYYGDNSQSVLWDDVNNPHFVDTDVEWSLRLHDGSDPGPDPITYHLTVTDSNGRPVHVGVHPDYGRDRTLFDDGLPGCTRFDANTADGHPWSRRDLAPTNPVNTNFVDTCTLTETGTGTFDLTLSGIDYSPAHLPTTDTSGHPLPTDWSYIATGSLWFRVLTSQAGSIHVHTEPMTYTSSTHLTSADLTGDNDTNKSYTLPGGFSSDWDRAWTRSGGTAWSDTYRVSPNSTIMAQTQVSGGSQPPGPDGIWGNCVIWQSQYLTYQGDLSDPANPYGGYQAQVVGYRSDPDAPAKNIYEPLNNAPAVEYYAGSVGDPDQFDCGSGTWSTTPPANLATVHAIRVRYNHSLYDTEGRLGIQLHAWLKVNGNVASGTDVWEFGSELRGNGTWIGPTAGSKITPTPGADYPYTTGRRDIVRIATATPSIRKSSPSSTVTAGVPADFTLTYSANGTGFIPPSVDNYVIRDVLPLGMTYVDGSADPDPVITTDTGHQVLTWTLDGVTTNEPHTLDYQAVPDASIQPGTALTNTATSSYGNITSPPASKTVTTTSNGYTQILKTADTPFIPNLHGDGSGTGSWTVTLTSNDPLPQPYTDVIDILPYNGDGRGTDFHGSYTLNQITPPAGSTVYYTTADRTALSDDPNDTTNGTNPGSIAGNSMGWSTTYTPTATAIRVIGPALAPGATLQFKVPITNSGATVGDVYVNRAQGVAGHTELKMRTSAKITEAEYYAATLKKYVQDVNGDWHDANGVADYPSFHYGDTIHYREVVTNVGQGTLHDIDITDDKQPQLGAFHIDSLAPGKSQSHEYSIKLGESTNGNVKNTACATAAQPDDANSPPEIPCDPAGFKVVNYITKKTADPGSGMPVAPGQTIKYTITVTQQGTEPADAMFSDDLSKVLDDADYNGDVTADIGTANYDKATQTLAWTGTVPVGGVAHVTYSVTVHDTDTLAKTSSDTDLLNPVTSPGCVPKDGQFPDCTTDHKTGYYTYSKVSDPKSGSDVGVSDTIKYTVTVVQHGEGPVAGAVVDDDMTKALDDAAYNSDAKPSSGAVSYSEPTLTWKGDLAVGAKVTITYTMTVDDVDTGDMHLGNVVTNPPGTPGFCDTSIGCQTVHQVGYYTFEKNSDPAPGSSVHPGDTISYTITIMQHGPGSVSGATLVDDMSQLLDDADFNNDAKASSGTLNYDAPTLTWKGNLAVGAKVTITYAVSVTGKGDDKLGNKVTDPDPRGSCDTSGTCLTTHQIIEPAAPASNGSGGLASTGTNVWLPLLLAVLMLGGGGVVLLTGRRRNS